MGIAELVPSVSEESHSEIASSLLLLAMTEKGTPHNDKRGASLWLLVVVASRRRGNLGKAKLKNQKAK